MKTTLAGKIFVFINLVLGLFFAGMALAVITHRVNWPGIKGAAPDQAEGLIKQKQDEIKKWEQGAQNGLARHEEALKELLVLEEDLPRKQKWYADQLAFLATGKDAAGKPLKDAKVSRLVYKGGQLELDDKGYPKLEPLTSKLKEGLKPIPQMVAIKTAVEEDIQMRMGEVAKVIAREKMLTLEINGNNGMPKGFRDLLAEEVMVEKDIQAELEYLRPLRYNRQVEAELLLKRQGSLKGRLRELEKIGVAVRER
jgi:hypothetical protein